jgi:hypothetical protein
MGLVADVSASHRDVKLRFAYDFLTYLSQGIWFRLSLFPRITDRGDGESLRLTMLTLLLVGSRSVAILSTYLTALADDKVEFVGYVRDLAHVPEKASVAHLLPSPAWRFSLSLDWR